MNLPPTTEQFRLASLGVACLAIYALSTGWAVFAVGSLESVSCSGKFQRLYCDAGSMLGNLFKPNSPWLGYILLQCLDGVFFFFVAWKAYVRSKA